MAQFSVESSSIGSEVSIITPENTNSKKSTFAYGIQPIYWFSRIFGYMPFKFVYDSNGVIRGARIRVIDVLWAIFSIGLHLFAMIHFLLTAGCTTENFEKSIILANGTKALVFLRRIFNCLCLGMELCSCFQLVDIFQRLNSFDEKVMNTCFGFKNLSNLHEYTFLLCERRWPPMEFILIMGKSAV